MKQLTQAEFDALGDGPHDAREVGIPIETEVLVWCPFSWLTCDTRNAVGWDGPRGFYQDVADFPIWHKLPADFEGDL